MRYKVFLEAGLLLGPLSAFAHHSFVAQYDPAQFMTLKGVISKIEWTNPHVYIQIDVKDAHGRLTTWVLEGYPPISLKRTGLPRDAFKIGEEITATAFKARDGSSTAAGREITFPGGSKKFLGGNHAGQPSRGTQ